MMMSRFSKPRYFCSDAPRPWLFVGLGNPGDKYKGTRHNVGFGMIDVFAQSQGIATGAELYVGKPGQMPTHLLDFSQIEMNFSHKFIAKLQLIDDLAQPRSPQEENEEVSGSSGLHE